MYRILHVCEACCGGVGTHLHLLFGGLLRRNQDLLFVYSDSRMDAAFQDAMENLDNSSFTRVPMTIATQPSIRDSAAIARLLQISSAYKPDLIHCHSTKAGLLGRVVGRAHRVPVIYTPHAYLSMRQNSSRWVSAVCAQYERTMSRITDLTIVVSEAEKQHALALGISERKLRLIPNGIGVYRGDSVQIRRELRSSLNIRDTEVCVGTVGRFVPQKNMENLLRALAVLCSDPALKFVAVLAGDGPLREPLMRLANQLGISARIRWPGEVNGRDLMYALDLYTVSSDYEGMSVAALEALSAGLPIVSTDVGGACEIVKQPENGFIVPTKDHIALANALKRVISNSALLGRMSASSKIRSAKFSDQSMVDKTIDAYDSVVGTRDSAVRDQLMEVDAHEHSKSPLRPASGQISFGQYTAAVHTGRILQGRRKN